MLSLKNLSFILALSLVAIAPGCFPRQQDSVQTVSPQPTVTVSPTEAPTSPPATAEPYVPPQAESPSPPATPEPEEPPVAPAPESPQAALPASCNDAQTQAEINECAAEAYQVADAELNQVYRELKNSLSGQDQDQLVDEELAWISYRDRTCEAERAPYEGGSIQPTIYYSCLERETRKRTAELRDQLAAN